MARVLISASHKSSGKTTLSVGLATALTARGLAVQTFKKGPDYIDPMWLARASGRPCYNLDFNTQSHDEIKRLLAVHARNAGLSLIEGNMGLHDGVDIEGSDSTAALAHLIGAPVILVIDCEGMTRGVAPLALGFQAFDTRIRIAGIILNRVATPRQQDKLVAAVERYSDIPVLGALPRSPEMTIVQRHLGLTTPAEVSGNDITIEHIGDMIRSAVNLDQVLEIARSVEPVEELTIAVAPPRAAADITIAVARDEAFGFYYADDMDALKRAGARLAPFSPIHDQVLPEADGLIIGGGFPETHMAALEANTSMRAAVQNAARAGLPIYAECGGLMYLARSIRWKSDVRQMAGAVEGDIIMHDRPQGRGLVILEQMPGFPWPAATSAGGAAARAIHAHEFHYAEINNFPSDTRFAWRVLRGHGIDGHHDGIVTGNILASFSHLRDTSAHHWAEGFADFVRGIKAARQRNPSPTDAGRASVRARPQGYENMTQSPSRLDAVIAAIDDANAGDPRKIEVQGVTRPIEILYAERMTARLLAMYPEASELLRIAARAQHLRRWEIARQNYPEGRNGYNDWRRSCREHHAKLVAQIMATHDYSGADIARVGMLIRKEQLKKDRDSQALENVVDVVFVEHYFDEFLDKYKAYDDDKIIDIVGKTLRKMSPKGHQAALQLDLPDNARRLIMAAVAREADALAKLAAVAID